ncbi:MAG TPA: MgtC/SapB family protein [Pyrinomonadaceae bacterium]
MDFLIDAFSFDWKQTLIDFLRIGLAFVLAVPIGWERHESHRNIGLRTFPIVAMAACGFMLIAKNVPGANAETHARLIQGLLGGIGFIGGGAILKKGANVRGLATAASIWGTGAIGAAVAFEREEIAVVLSLIMFLTLRILSPIVEDDHHSDHEASEAER